MAEQEKVENFKLTKGQRDFQKSYKKLKGIGNVLSQKIAQHVAEGRSMGQMLEQINGGLNQMLQQAPKNPMSELEGQPVVTPTTGGVRN